MSKTTNGQVRTMRGRIIDMAAIVSANAHVRAIGNASMNARGDKIDIRGNIVRTAEQIHADRVAYNRENPNAVRLATMSALESEVFATPADVFKSDPNKITQPTVVTVEKAPPKKKIISDE